MWVTRMQAHPLTFFQATELCSITPPPSLAYIREGSELLEIGEREREGFEWKEGKYYYNYGVVCYRIHPFKVLVEMLSDVKVDFYTGVVHTICVNVFCESEWMCTVLCVR